MATRRLDREHLRLIGCAQLPNATRNHAHLQHRMRASGGHPGRDDHPSIPFQQPLRPRPVGRHALPSGRGRHQPALPLRGAAVLPVRRLLLAARPRRRPPADGRTALLPTPAGALAGVEPALRADTLQPARGGERGLPARHGRPVADAARGSAQRLVGGRHDPPLVPARPDGGGADPGALPAGPPAEAGPAAGGPALQPGPDRWLLWPAAAGGRVGPADPQRPLLLLAVRGAWRRAAPACLAAGRQALRPDDDGGDGALRPGGRRSAARCRRPPRSS